MAELYRVIGGVSGTRVLLIALTAGADACAAAQARLLFAPARGARTASVQTSRRTFAASSRTPTATTCSTVPCWRSHQRCRRALIWCALERPPLLRFAARALTQRGGRAGGRLVHSRHRAVLLQPVRAWRDRRPAQQDAPCRTPGRHHARRRLARARAAVSAWRQRTQLASKTSKMRKCMARDGGSSSM